MQLMAVVLLKRQGLSPEKRIVLAATADEEAGSTWGAGWLMQHVPEKLKARYVINEGGGLGLSTKRGNLHFCQVAKKAYAGYGSLLLASRVMHRCPMAVTALWKWAGQLRPCRPITLPGLLQRLQSNLSESLRPDRTFCLPMNL